MGPRQRGAVSTYLETFVLVGVAMGGSAIVYSSLEGYAAAQGGPAVSIEGLAILQAGGLAIERVTIGNVGTVSMSSFTVGTAGVSSAVQYCVELSDSGGAALNFLSPPPACGAGTATDPTSIPLTPSSAIPPGRTVVLTVIVYSSNEFSVGQGYSVTVSTGAALQEAAATASPG